MYDQDIIEKKPSSPVSTTLLGISLLAFIGAMVFQVMHVKRYSEGLNTSPLQSAAAWEKSNKLESIKFDTQWKAITKKLDAQENNPEAISEDYNSAMEAIRDAEIKFSSYEDDTVEKLQKETLGTLKSQGHDLTLED